MSVSLKPISTIKADLGINPSGAVQKKLQMSCYRHMMKYVPYREGRLVADVDLSDPKKIVFESKYAHYMYIGKKYVMSNGKSAYYSPNYGFWSDKGVAKIPTNEDLVYHTPGTGPYWDKRMVSAEIDSVIKEVQKYVGRKS